MVIKVGEEEIWDRLEINAQPFYSLEKHRIVGTEALIRCRSNKSVGAFEIINSLTKQNRLIDFDIFMVERVCQYMAYLKEDIGTPCIGSDIIPNNSALSKGHVNVNISPITINTDNISNRILSIIDYYNVKDRICLEINEQSLFDNIAVDRNIDNLLSNNIALALDDFNVMNSSIQVLSKYDVKEVKIRQQDLDVLYRKNEIILKHLKNMFNELDIDVVIEGVETQQQLELLTNLGYKTIQGYIIGRPLPISIYTEERFKCV